MKKCKRYVSLFLACVLVLALLPAQVVAAAAQGAYSVLAESTIEVWWMGDAYQNAVVVDFCQIMEYTGSGIREISVGESVYWIDGFTSNGYAAVLFDREDENKRPDKIVDAAGQTVCEGTYLLDFYDDGSAVFYDDEFDSDYVWDSATKSRIDIHLPEGVFFSSYGEGVVVAHDSDSDSCFYCDTNGSVLFDGKTFHWAYAPTNGYFRAYLRDSDDFYTVIMDKSGNVVLSDRGQNYNIEGNVTDDGLVPVRWLESHESGYVDLTGKKAETETKYSAGHGYWWVYNDDWKLSLVDPQGNIVIPYGTSYYTFSNVTEEGILWALNQDDNHLCVLGVGKANSGQSIPEEYIYNAPDPGESVVLPVEKLDTVTNAATASSAVNALTTSMTTEQKQSATGVDLATLYAETAVATAASKPVNSNEIIINAAAVSELEKIAAQTNQAVESALVQGGVTTARYLSNTVSLTTNATGKITIKIDPDILTTGVDKIRVETSAYALTFDVEELRDDLTQVLTFTAQEVNNTGNFAGRLPVLAAIDHTKLTPAVGRAMSATIDVDMAGGKTSNPITISLPTNDKNTTYQAVVNANGTPTSSKYNPATDKMDGKINSSGTYTVVSNEKDFTDITKKSAEMQKAIRYLASKGIISGTSDTQFSPDKSISRAEIAALLVRTLGWTDNSSKPTFSDVTTGNWYYSAAGASQRHGLINGYAEDNTFRGDIAISKVQILAVASRVLKNKMGYREPSNPTSYLKRYSDDVTLWAQPEVALATKENLVVYRTDGTLKGDSNMTRGDAAIIIYRLLQKIW